GVASRLQDKFITLGIWRTAWHVIFIVFLERIGFHLNYAFQRQMKNSGLPAFTTGFSAHLARQMEDLTELDRSSIMRYGGASLLRRARKSFAAGKVCIIIRSPTGELSTMCWAEKVNAFAPCTTAPCVLVAKCFTLPKFRGLGLYESVLKAVGHLVPNDMSCLGNTVIECSVFNYASRSGISKAGFQICGMAVEIGPWRITWPKKRT
ncbi:MAG: hypothetical protein ACRD28_03445, partial [Acidobacteriaceae bacterium]